MHGKEELAAGSSTMSSAAISVLVMASIVVLLAAAVLAARALAHFGLVYYKEPACTRTVALAVFVITVVAGCVAKHAADTSEMRRQAILRGMATTAISAFNDNGVKYWLDFSTLLGVVRDGDIILGDNDVDMCIGDDAKTQLLLDGPVRARLQAQGYRIERQTWDAYRIKPQLYRPKHWLFVDVYITKRLGDVVVGATGPDSNVASALIGTPKWIAWPRAAINVLVPTDVDGVLVWRYGADYMTPKRNYKGRAPNRRKRFPAYLEGLLL
jgi:hypothetical protein